MFTGFSQMVEEINSSIGVTDTNKERNLKSTDPVFVDKFKKEWDEITSKLRSAYAEGKKVPSRKKTNSYVRYSASAVEFR